MTGKLNLKPVLPISSVLIRFYDSRQTSLWSLNTRMVSRVYTPLITPYQRKQPAGDKNATIGNPTQENAKHFASLPEDPTNTPVQNAGLQAVQFNQFQKIPLTAVVSDFKNTLTALGADDQTRSEVMSYLNVVRLQAAKDVPDTGYMKQSLRVAANTMDQYIGKALGQPSKVVREWVDALLMQDIDFKADISAEELGLQANTKHSQPESQSEVTKAAAPPSPESAQFKALIQEAKAFQQQKNYEQADGKLQEALALLAGKNKPGLEGKVWNFRGRIFEQAGQWKPAVNAFKQAADQFELAQEPQKQSQALQSAGSILEEQGRFAKAKPYYSKATELDTQFAQPEAVIHSLNNLGSVALKTGDTQQAIQSFQSALQTAQKTNAASEVKTDLTENLAVAYRQNRNYDQAIESYQSVLAQAKAQRDKPRYTGILQQLAALYAEINQPQQAMQALQRLQKFQASA